MKILFPQQKIDTTIIGLFLVLFIFGFTNNCLAYSGGYGILPALINGPDKKEMNKFDITTDLTNPQTIVTDLTYIYQVTIATSTPESGNLMIIENPTGDEESFSFSVPKKIQDSMLWAEILFWAPNTETLSVTHVHNSGDPKILTGTKIEPVTPNANGDVLWSITTTSFSEFYLSAMATDYQKNWPTFSLILLIICSASAVILFRFSF